MVRGGFAADDQPNPGWTPAADPGSPSQPNPGRSSQPDPGWNADPLGFPTFSLNYGQAVNAFAGNIDRTAMTVGARREATTAFLRFVVSQRHSLLHASACGR
jgi:hypothetical protein